MAKPNAITWTIWMLAGVLLCSLTYNPLHLALMLATVIALSLTLKISPTRYLKTAVLFGIPLLLINTLFIHTGEHAILTIPNQIAGIPLPLISGAITLESIYAGIVFMLLMAVMLLVFMIYQNQTTPEAVIRLIPKSLSHSALLTSIALRFIPTLSLDVQSITEANRSRGARLENTSIAQKIRNHGSLIIPTLVNSLERSYNLAESLESRGYGGERTRYQTETRTFADEILTTIYIMVIVTTVALKFHGKIPSWNFADVGGAFSPVSASPLVILMIVSFILPGVCKWRR